MHMIVGIGELLWDIYSDGREVAGGAPFNFACHCRQLGHSAAIVSRVGDDDLGRELRDEVRRLGVSDQYIQTDYEHSTGTVEVTLDANKVPSYRITQDVAWDYIGKDGLNEGFAQELKAICFGTLAQRSPTSRHAILDLVAARSTPNALRVFDINLRPPFLPEPATLQKSLIYADWVKLSDDDRRLLPLEFAKLSAQVSTLRQADQEELVWILTKGREGCDLLSMAGELIATWPALPARVVDTVGAGDAFTAAMVCLHLEGRPLHECAQFANSYAARVCEHPGATPKIDRAEVERAAFASS
jgi:fructokinase